MQRECHLGVAAPERIFGCSAAMDGLHGTLQSFRSRFGKTEIANLPSFTSSAIALTVSSIGVLGSTRCW